MQDSVLTLGERIVLAARLASIEHVRQELSAYTAQRSGATKSTSARAARNRQSSAAAVAAEAEETSEFVRRNWAEYFDKTVRPNYGVTSKIDRDIAGPMKEAA